MAKELAIVLNNGSVNSVVATAMAAQRYRPVLVYFETVQSQPGCRRAYERQVAHFKPFREHTIPAPSVGEAASDAATGTALAQRLLDLVPLVAIAGNVAARCRAAAVYLGLRVGTEPNELAQVTEYVQIWNELLQLPCGQENLEIVTPLADLEPWQVIDAGSLVGAPFDRTWSCHENGEAPCGLCRGCRHRQAAFVQAAKADPLAPRTVLQRTP
jgi:hypothetical protein